MSNPKLRNTVLRHKMELDEKLVENYKDFLCFVNEALKSSSTLGLKIKYFWDERKDRLFKENMDLIGSKRTALFKKEVLKKAQNQTMIEIHEISLSEFIFINLKKF